LRDDVLLGVGRRLRAQKDAVVGVRALAVLLNLLLQRRQPVLDQVDVLQDGPVALWNTNCVSPELSCVRPVLKNIELRSSSKFELSWVVYIVIETFFTPFSNEIA
jgi:hypothetical protein